MTRFGRCVFLLVLTFSFSFVRFSAQSTTAASQPASAQQAPAGNVATLHTGAKLVVVDVIVRDKSGHPVHGLTRDDFQLSEGGKSQSLNSFEEYAAPAAPPSPPQMPNLPPGLFTNFTPVSARGPLNILLIDGLNTQVADEGYVRQQLLDYVQHIPPGTRIAILGLSNHLYMLQGFTSDPGQLRSILEKIKSWRPSMLLNGGGTDEAALLDSLTDSSKGSANGSNGSALMGNDVATFIAGIEEVQLSIRIQESIEAFSSLGQWLVNFPGRKNVIWFSGSFPLGVDPTAPLQNNTDIPSEDDDEFRAMLNLLTRAQVSVYPVDPRGVQADSAFTLDADINPNQGGAYQRNTSSFYKNEVAEHSTMQAFASDTGGVPFYNRNNLTKAVEDVIENGANYYTLTYSPSEKKTGGEWRRIRVELANPGTYKGAQLSYRSGYFADNLKVPAHKTGTAEVTEDPNTPSVESSRNAHLAMLHGAPTPQDIPFTARVLPASRSTEDLVAAGNGLDPKDPIKPPYRRYDVDCAAAARYFNLSERPDGHRVGSVQVAVFAYDPRGKVLNGASRTLTLDLTPEEFAAFQKLGVREHLEISVPAKGESFLRIGIEEKSSGRVGALEVATSSVSNLPPAEYAQAPAQQTGSKAVPDSSSHP